MAPPNLPMLPGIASPLATDEVRDDVLTAELIEYCSRFQLPAVLPDTIEAGDAWGANCGPISLAAVLGLPTVEAARPLVQPFRGFMSPTDMRAALNKQPKAFTLRGLLADDDPWPALGLVRIQWLGKWMEATDRRASYRYTHWVGARYSRGAPMQRVPTNAELEAIPTADDLTPQIWVYDATPNRWIPLWVWERWCSVLWSKRATGWAPVTRIDVSLKTGS